MRRYMSLAAGSLLIAATMVFAQEHKPSDKDRQLHEQLVKDFETLYNRQDVAGVAALFTDDAVQVRPEGVLEGRAALEKEYQSEFHQGCRDLVVSYQRLPEFERYRMGERRMDSEVR